MKEIIEMIQILSEMGTDAYTECKYILLSVSAGHQGTHNFMDKLFEVTDRYRPISIGMKEGVLGMVKDKENFATEIIGEIKRQRNIWRMLAIVSIALNIIQWLF